RSVGQTFTHFIAAAALTAALIPVPAFGHHSHAMFDRDTTLTVTGTVDTLDWTNPHVWLHVNASDEAGEVVRWSLELGSPAQIARRGWRPRTVSPGDTVALNPLFNGEPIGSLVGIALPDGSHLGEEEFLN
ncbi:MAG: DUF6152 family protein, partial [Alphaproteobacteria bacterium]